MKKEKKTKNLGRAEVILNSLLKVDHQERVAILTAIISMLGLRELPPDSPIRGLGEKISAAVAGGNYATGLLAVYEKIMDEYKAKHSH